MLEQVSDIYAHNLWSFLLSLHDLHDWRAIIKNVLCLCQSIRQSVQAHIPVTVGRNFFIWGKMMAYDPGLMPVLFHFFSGPWWPFTILLNNIAVVNRVLSKHLFKKEMISNMYKIWFQVFYVDYGNIEIVEENHIRQIEPYFLTLPFQAVECFLPLDPVAGGQKWKEEAKWVFLNHGWWLKDKEMSCIVIQSNLAPMNLRGCK